MYTRKSGNRKQTEAAAFCIKYMVYYIWWWNKPKQKWIKISNCLCYYCCCCCWYTLNDISVATSCLSLPFIPFFRNLSTTFTFIFMMFLFPLLMFAIHKNCLAYKYTQIHVFNWDERKYLLMINNKTKMKVGFKKHTQKHS